jgi:hypothetical protein
MKAERRLEAKTHPSGPRAPGEDPDIAGIVPGPQRRGLAVFFDIYVSLAFRFRFRLSKTSSTV